LAPGALPSGYPLRSRPQINRKGGDILSDLDIWIVDEEYDKKIEFLSLMYKEVENEFLEYLKYVPLKKDNFKVSSMLLADLIPRIFRYIESAFKALVFGKPMKAFYERLITLNLSEGELKTELYNDLENIPERASVSDYYTFFSKENKEYIKLFFIEGTLLNQKIRPIRHIGLVEYEETIEPFKPEEWNRLKRIRNDIVHNQKMDARLYDVFQALACLAILLDKRYSGWVQSNLESELFGITEIRFA